MKILITGASGFVGKALLNYLSNKNLVIKTASLRKIKAVNNIDFTDVDVVIHLAALVHQMQGADSNAYMESNFEITKSLAMKAKEDGVGKFIFISTVKVYGESFPEKTLNEKSDCVPEDPYGESKLLAEKCLQKFAGESFKIAILRLPLVYGAGVKGNFINLLNLHASKKIIPFKNIKTKRSMVYVGNVCALIHSLINYKGKQQIFIAADQVEPIQLNRLSELLLLNLKRKNKAIFCKLPKLIILLIKKIKPGLYARLFEDFVLDASLTFKELNYTPKYSSDEAITNTCQWYLEKNV